MSTREYNKGYNAGRRYGEKRIAELEARLEVLNEQQLSAHDRRYFRCLEIALQNCSDWVVNKKKVNDASGFCTIAKHLLENGIEVGGIKRREHL